MVDRRWFLMVAGFFLFSGLAIVWFGWMQPIQEHLRWNREVRKDLHALYEKRPSDVSRRQWEHVVGWTLNLHANAGGIHSNVDPDWRDQFATELRRRLGGPMTIADIDWIWDEYAKHTKIGSDYSDQYRPRLSPEFTQADK